VENLSSLIRPRPSNANQPPEEQEEAEGAPGRIANSTPISVIDIGSNSVRLVVFERLARAPTQLFNEKALCGLGRGVSATGRLEQSAVDSALASIRRFAALNSQLRVGRVDVLATAAVRDAENGAQFIDMVEEICGTSVTTLSGREEARLSALGIISSIQNPDGICGDLGGGSLELVEVAGTEFGSGETYPLGGLSLEDASGGDRSKAQKIASKALAESKVLKRGKRRTFYAIGGTWRSLARLHMQQTGYPLRVMHHYTIDADEAIEFCRMVSRHEVESLDSIEAVSKSRRPLLPTGAVVLGEILAAMKPSQVVMSALGLREGHLYDLMERGQQAEDPLLVAAEELAILRSRSPRHSRELAEWTDGVFAAMNIDEAADEVRLRKAGCLLADIGWRAHAEYRGLQSLNMIANAALIGIDHPGRAFLALAVYYRHEGVGAEFASPRLREIATPRLIERARVLGGTIRVAHMISASMPGIITRTRMELRGSELTIVLPQDLASLAGDRLMRRMRQLAKIGGWEPAIAIEH
jgi:exopolyphosphatase/guanosine-5'-triphosphate,3'-diphosphate pyrophosphatase